MLEPKSLLQMGNLKLGKCISTWSLPAGINGSCVGASPNCLQNCYARRSRFLFPKVQERFAWNWEQAKLESFTGRMIKEIKSQGHLVIRLHISGDFPDEDYATKWLNIMRACPKAKFYWYSRSYIFPSIAKVLEQMAALKCCVGYYSYDASMDVPTDIPPGVRLAFLQVDEEDKSEKADLVFRVRRLRKKCLPLPLVCPSERGKNDGITCGSCTRCFTK